MAFKQLGTFRQGNQTFAIGSDIQDLEKQLKSMSRTGFKRASFRAINRAAAKAQTAVKRSIAIQRNIKIGTAGAGLSLQKASENRLDASIIGRGGMIPLYVVKGSKTQKALGVTVAAVQGKRRLRKGAFIATMPSGHTGIFKREREGSTDSGRVGRLGVQEMLLPSIAHTLQSPTTINIGIAAFQSAFAAAFQGQLNNEIRKARV